MDILGDWRCILAELVGESLDKVWQAVAYETRLLVQPEAFGLMRDSRIAEPANFALWFRNQYILFAPYQNQAAVRTASLRS